MMKESKNRRDEESKNQKLYPLREREWEQRQKYPMRLHLCFPIFCSCGTRVLQYTLPSKKELFKITIPIDETLVLVSMELRCETICAYTSSVAWLPRQSEFVEIPGTGPIRIICKRQCIDKRRQRPECITQRQPNVHGCCSATGMRLST